MTAIRHQSELQRFLTSEKLGEIRLDEPLAPWTSIKVGGRAEAWVKPSTPDALVKLLRFAQQSRTPVSMLGGGANTLVSDHGVEGFTLKLASDFLPEEIDRETFVLCGGAAITRLITLMKQHQKVGAEFLAGIPGTIGGATAMNAGTKNGECMSRVEAVELATPSGLGWVSNLTFRYRHTDLPPGAVVTRVRFVLQQGDLVASQDAMTKDLSYRKSSQPLTQPNFGSVFTNPPGNFAGKLIESVSLKGHTIGKAQISTQHANWIVNLGGATARDVVSLMDLARHRVAEASGITLEPEVKRIGRFDPP